MSQQNIAEYKILLDTLVFRVNALSVSAVQVVAEGKLSLITLPSSSSSLVGCILDVGRCNSFIPLSNFGFSYFQDYYHREAHFLGKNCFSLIKESCIGSSQETLIPIAAHLLPLVSRFVGLNALRQQSFSNSHEAHPKIWFVIAATQSADKVLHMLGRLGALPNRDWQLANFSLGFNQVNEIADAYIKKLTHEHYQLRSLFDEQNALPYFSSSCEDKIKELIDSIRLLKKGYSPSFQAEQRFFYLNFIEKLLLAFKHLHTGVQARLALARMDKLLQQTTSNNYTIFLRTIEALINEFLILKLLEQEKHPKTAQMLMEEIKAFIIQTVDAAPQMATFRTSAMQAISSSLQLAFTIFDSKRKKAPF
ncbi:MAG: hypothetical protein PSV35_03975, partial [bacterium]|nr:hypothetical protein [bacterium]